jgi:ribonuclease HIII
MQQELSDYISWLLQETEKQNITLIDSRDIPYGQQLKFADSKSEIPVNIYYSARKGISVVIGGSKQGQLFSDLNLLIFKSRISPEKQHNWQRWAGTDESGKGDFFGPLVVCGFIMERKFEKKFSELGVQDSKRLSDEKVRKIAEYLYSNHRRNFDVIALQPRKYNELYEQFKQQGKKLNELLAWMHGRVILNLNNKNQFEGAVIDKFAKDSTLKNSLSDLKKLKLIQRYRAEDDPAVACASIIARYNFVKYLKEFSQKYDMEFPLGAGKNVVEFARLFTSKLSKAELFEVAKIHFKNYKELD